MNSFKTKSTARKSVLTIIYTFIPMFLMPLVTSLVEGLKGASTSHNHYQRG